MPPFRSATIGPADLLPRDYMDLDELLVRATAKVGPDDMPPREYLGVDALHPTETVGPDDCKRSLLGPDDIHIPR